jgi:hypothetical protein
MYAHVRVCVCVCTHVYVIQFRRCAVFILFLSRVSCEAIPEEISGLGTTPPAGDSEENMGMETSPHPQLLSCHSYPGTGAIQSPTQQPAATRTVPQSPTSVVSKRRHEVQHISKCTNLFKTTLLIDRRCFRCIHNLVACLLKSPHVIVEWLTLLLHIQEVPGSYLGPETGYPE